MTFFRQLNFTSANEDGATELAALAGVGGRMLCLCGSGARPLDMLLGEADEIVALDVNPVQLHLLELKIAAYRTLVHDELLAYLGLRPSENRAALHARVSRALPGEARDFWNENQRVILEGVWYAGLWERVLGRLGAAHRAVRGGALDALFGAEDVPAQVEVWRSRFDGPVLRWMLNQLGRRWIWTRAVGEPGGAYLPDRLDSGRIMRERLASACSRFLLRESDFAALLILGRHFHSLPLHLRAENFERVRDGLDRITPCLGGLRDLTPERHGLFDSFSLSDFGSYCDQTVYDACWTSVRDVARPGAHYCERVFLNDLTPRVDVVDLAPDRSARLTASDKAIIYEIRAGTIG